MMAPRPVTAKDARMLALLAEEQTIAQNRYALRSHRDNAHQLHDRAVRARLTYRRFFRLISGWHNWPQQEAS